MDAITNPREARNEGKEKHGLFFRNSETNSGGDCFHTENGVKRESYEKRAGLRHMNVRETLIWKYLV